MVLSRCYASINAAPKMYFLSHHTVVWGVFSLLCFLFVVCMVTDFSVAENDRGMKFCMHVRLLSGQVFSPLANFGSRGVTVAALLPGCMWPQLEQGIGSR